MRMPKSVIAGSRAYKVKVVPAAKLKGKAGETDPNHPRTITIVKDPSRDYMMSTFVHELFHAFTFESGLAQILDEQAREMLADGASSLLMGVFDLRFKREKK